MLDRVVLSATRPAIHRLAERLAKAGLSAEQVTWAGFAIGMLALPLIATGHPLLAILPILANRMMDALDGAVARINGATDRGAFLDISLDFLFYSSIPLAFAIMDPAGNALAAAVLIYAFVGTGSTFLAFAILAARRGIDNPAYPGKGFHYIGGLTEATETIFLFMLMAVWPEWFSWLAFGFSALCGLTIISRIATGLATFRD